MKKYVRPVMISKKTVEAGMGACGTAYSSRCGSLVEHFG